MSRGVASGAAGALLAAPGEDSADLRVRILAVATRLFAERGWAGTHVREVAAEAGCTKPALYYHFSGKDALFLEALASHGQRLVEIQAVSHDEASTVAGRLRLSFARLFTYAREERHALWMLYRAGRQPEEGQPDVELEPLRHQARRLTVAMLRDGVASGELRPDLDLELATDMIHGVIDHRLTNWFYAGDPIPEGYEQQILDALLKGLAA